MAEDPKTETVIRTLKVLTWPEYRRDDLNPYVSLVYQAFREPRATVANLKLFGSPVPGADVFHIQWTEAIFWAQGRRLPVAAAKAMAVLRAVRAVRRRGGHVALTLHNLKPHGAPSVWHQKVWRAFYGALLRRTDLVIAMSQASLAEWRAAYPSAAKIPAIVIMHPHYRDRYPPAPPKAEARRVLGLTEVGVIVGVVGMIRASKMVPEAITAFREGAKPEERMLVAGGCDDPALWARLETAAGGDSRVILRNMRLSDEDLVRSIAACDICLVNQGGTMNSGTVLLALSQNRPLIAPDVGSLPEIAQVVGTEWLALVTPPLSPKSLRQAIDRLIGAERAMVAPLEPFEPQAVSLATLAALQARAEQQAERLLR